MKLRQVMFSSAFSATNGSPGLAHQFSWWWVRLVPMSPKPCVRSRESCRFLTIAAEAHNQLGKVEKHAAWSSVWSGVWNNVGSVPAPKQGRVGTVCGSDHECQEQHAQSRVFHPINIFSAETPGCLTISCKSLQTQLLESLLCMIALLRRHRQFEQQPVFPSSNLKIVKPWGQLWMPGLEPNVIFWRVTLCVIGEPRNIRGVFV